MKSMMPGPESWVGDAGRVRTYMRKLTLLLLGLLIMSWLATAAPGQGPRQPSDADTCAACGTCGIGGAAIVAIPVVIIVLNIALLVWVARDAKSRGMDSAVLWMVLVMFTSLLGLVIYIFPGRRASSSGVRVAATTDCKRA